MTYASVEDVQARMSHEMSDDERLVCSALLEDAGVLIDATAISASPEIKRIVSCRMVARAVGDNGGAPTGASQGSMSGLGYSQSWTIGSGGAVGELYLSKTERQMLGKGRSIGFHGPLEVEA